MSDFDTTLAAIDVAVGCQRCGGPRGDLSPDFCGEDCQTAWHAARTDPLRRTQAQALMESLGRAIEQMGQAMGPLVEQFQRIGADPREQRETES